jgi:hypothetical protein
MKLCLSCRHLSPGNDHYGVSLFCPHCGLSFGARRCRSCKKKPGSPLDAHHCVHCGGTNMSDAAYYLELGWLVRLTAWGVVFLIGRWLWFRFGFGGASSTGVSSHGRTWLDAVLIGTIELCGRILIVGGTLYVLLLLTSSVISLVFPVSVGKGIGNLLAGGLKAAGQLLVAGVKLGAKGVYRLVEGDHKGDHHKTGK